MASMNIPFGPWEPSEAYTNVPALLVAQNTYPGARGWRPVPSFVAQSDALPANCKGLWIVEKADGSFAVYAATATKIYRLDSTDFSWDDVSRTSGGDYALPADDFWRGVQFGSRFILTNLGDDPQYIDVDSGANFAALGGSPGPARFVEIMDNRVVLGNLSSDPEGIKWSDINDSDEWSAGVADSQTFPDHGAVQGIFPHAKMILLRSGTRQIVYTGDDTSFQFPELTTIKGSIVPFGTVELGGVAFWLSDDDFYMGNAYEQRPIGHNRIAEYFFDQVNHDRLWQINGTHDPFAPRILIAYPTGDTAYNDRILVYDWSLDQGPGSRCFSELEVDTYVLARTASPGTTLEGLDSVSASLDALAVSLDSRLWRGGAPQLAAVDTDLKLAYQEGTPMAAQFRTSAFGAVPGWRSMLREAYPIIEGTPSGTTLTIGGRDKINEASSQGGAQSPDDSGWYMLDDEARFHDVQMDIPAGETWTNVQGLNPVDFVRTSQL